MSAFPKIEGKHHEVEKLRGKGFFFWHEVFLELFYRKSFISDYDNSSTLWSAIWVE